MLESNSSKEDVEKDGSRYVAPHDVEANMEAWPNADDKEIEHAIVEDEQPNNEKSKSINAEVNFQTAGLARVLTRRSATSSKADPGPPPDGGMVAWTQCLCCHLTIFSTFGYISSFGTFQTYYESTLGVSPSTISWIGSVQLFLLFFIGTFSGRAMDAGLFRPVYITGAVFQLLGIFTTASCNTFWQLFLSQALCSGIANGLQFCPAMSLLTTYFAKRRALAVGLASLGSCTGGVVFPVIVQQLLPKVGFGWTVRVIGFIMLATNLVAIAFFRTRLPPRKTGPIVEWAAFREAPYALYCVAMFFNFWGLYFTFFYVGSYGRDVLHTSYQNSINLLLTVVCAGFLFRTLPNWFADSIGSLNVLIPFAYLGGLMMFVWIAIDSLPGLYVFAALYGSASAVIQALWPAMFNSLSKVPDLKRAGVRMGMAFSVVSFACLTGPPLAGALIQTNGGKYLHAQIWAGISFFLGGTLLIAARTAKVGWSLRARI